LKKVKTIHRFDKLALDKGDSSLEFFNRATQNYGLWQQVLFGNRTKKKTIIVFVESYKKE
jgi:phosphoglycerol transferase MdoB-like AlkP superfamily enzyme